MDKIKKYQQILRKELEYQASIPSANAPKLTNHIIIDADNRHFMIMVIGWYKKVYKHYALLHFEIRNEKILVHQNNLDIDLNALFKENQIPDSDIVISFVALEEEAINSHNTSAEIVKS